MAITGYVPLFEIPSLKSLENDIKCEFGEAEIKKVKKSGLSLETKIIGQPILSWSKQDYKKKGEEIIGKVYTLNNTLFTTPGYSVKNADTFSSNPLGENYRNVYIDLKIESDKTIRFYFQQ